MLGYFIDPRNKPWANHTNNSFIYSLRLLLIYLSHRPFKYVVTDIFFFCFERD